MKLTSKLIVFALLCCFSLTARAGSAETVRQTALKLRAQVVEDEQAVDAQIAAQRAFYEKQTSTITDSQADNFRLGLGIDAFRRARSADEASAMSRDPNREVRIASLMGYLIETHDQEFALWQKLFVSDQRTREDIQTKLAKLERQKKLLQQVEDNLTQLSISANGKKRAKALLAFSQSTYDLYKKSDGK